MTTVSLLPGLSRLVTHLDRNGLIAAIRAMEPDDEPPAEFESMKAGLARSVARGRYVDDIRELVGRYYAVEANIAAIEAVMVAEAAASHEPDLDEAIRIVQARIGHPTDHPRGWKGFCDDVRALSGATVCDRTIERRFRKLTDTGSDTDTTKLRIVS